MTAASPSPNDDQLLISIVVVVVLPAGGVIVFGVGLWCVKRNKGGLSLTTSQITHRMSHALNVSVINR